MTIIEAPKTLAWHWTSYKRCGWARVKDGRRLYSANFRLDVSPLEYRTLYIQFWATRPIVALQQIVDSGRDPNGFLGKVVN